MPNSPIFIVGVHRSGTTLLRYMLSSSPRIYIPPESDFIPRFFERAPKSRLSTQQIRRFLRIIFKEYRFVGEWKGDTPAVEVLLQEMATRTPRAFLDALYRMYARQHNATRWGDKTPIYTSYIGLIHQIFPQAQFVHIIRDGRDVALSTLDKWGEDELHVDIYYAARIWMRRIRQARHAGARLGPEQYHELRYENLVLDPETELHTICDFLGEPFLPQMVESHRYARTRIEPEGFHAPVRRPPNSSRVERWRNEMSAADQSLFQYVASSLLDELGYEVAELERLSLPEKARLSALKTKYETLQAGRRIMEIIGLFPPIYGSEPKK